MTRRIGILGGSFDPVHPGHLALGRAASIALGLDEIRLMPVARSWQKQDTRATAEQRLELLRLALKAEGLGERPSGGARSCAWHIDQREIDRGPPTYTMDTLLSLRAELASQGQPGTALCLILGSDQFARIDTWHRWRELLDHCHLAVTTRLPVMLNRLSGEAEKMMAEFGVPALPDAPAGKITTFRMQAVHLSSTQIRELLASDRKLGLELLHPPVAARIQQLGLYQ